MGVKDNIIGVFVLLYLLVFIVLLDSLRNVFSFKGDLFIFELLLFLFLLIMAIDSMRALTNKNLSGFSVLSVFFAITLINYSLLAVFSHTVSLDLSLIIVAGLGFIISVINIIPSSKALEKEEFEKYEHKIEEDDIDEGEVIMEEIRPVKEDEPLKVYYPGKFLASKTGKKYHSPKCEFAKKIPKKNHVWFNTIDQAKKKGYRKCKCL